MDGKVRQMKWMSGWLLLFCPLCIIYQLIEKSVNINKPSYQTYTRMSIRLKNNLLFLDSLKYFYLLSAYNCILMPSLKECKVPLPPISSSSIPGFYSVFLPNTVLTGAYNESLFKTRIKSSEKVYHENSRSRTFCPPIAVHQVAKQGSAHRPLTFSGDRTDELFGKLESCTYVSTSLQYRSTLSKYTHWKHQ